MSDLLAWILAAHAVLYVAIGFRVIVLRWTRKVALGDGGDRDLKRAIRVHANFAEWVPLALLLLVAAELRGVSESIVGGLGGALLLARVGHALGLSRSVGVSVGRTGGTALTLTVVLLSAIAVAVGG